jgi:CHAD domain-containing protein
MSVAEAFTVLATSTAAEAQRRAHALQSAADPEALHKLRVALRRLRSLWWAYSPVLDRTSSKSQRQEFKLLADAAGRIRDWDVLRELLEADRSKKQLLVPLLPRIDELRAKAFSLSRRAIECTSVEQSLQRAFEGAQRQLELSASGITLAAFAEDRVKSAEKGLKKRVKQAVAQDDSDYDSLHEVRIAGKKLRYLLEFFSPVLDGSHRAAIERLAAVQDELGKLNDLVTGEALLREYVSGLGDPTLVDKAIRYLQEQKTQHTCIAHRTLREIR